MEGHRLVADLKTESTLHNRNQAQLYYEILAAVAKAPFLIAYYDEAPEKPLLVYDLSPGTLEYLEVPEEIWAIYLREVRDRSLLALLSLYSLKGLQEAVATGEEAELNLLLKRSNCYRRSHCQIKPFPWGVHISLEDRLDWSQAKNLPLQIQAIAAWVSQLNKSLKTLIAAVVGLGLSVPSAWIFQSRSEPQPPVFVAENPSLNQVEEQVEEAEEAEEVIPIEEQIGELIALESQRLKLPNYRAIAYYEYLSNHRTRRYVAYFSTQVHEQVFEKFRLKNTTEDGWDKVLAAHASHRIAVINRDDYASNHPLALFMRSAGAKQLRLYPVYGEELIGYLSISFAQKLPPEKIPSLDQQLIRLSVLVAHLQAQSQQAH